MRNPLAMGGTVTVPALPFFTSRDRRRSAPARETDPDTPIPLCFISLLCFALLCFALLWFARQRTILSFFPATLSRSLLAYYPRIFLPLRVRLFYLA